MRRGILYASVYVTVYNILLWTVGYSFVTKKVNVKEIAKSILTAPCIIAVFIGLILYGLKCACAGYYRHSAFNRLPQ